MSTALVPAVPGRPVWLRDGDWCVCVGVHDQWHLAERARLLRRLAAAHPDRRGTTPDDVGIYRQDDGHRTGWQAVVRLGRSRTIRKYFPTHTPRDVMRQWRADVRAEFGPTRSSVSEAWRLAAQRLAAFDAAERRWYDAHGLVPPPGGTKVASRSSRHPLNSKQKGLAA